MVWRDQRPTNAYTIWFVWACSPCFEPYTIIISSYFRWRVFPIALVGLFYVIKYEVRYRLVELYLWYHFVQPSLKLSSDHSLYKNKNISPEKVNDFLNILFYLCVHQCINPPNVNRKYILQRSNNRRQVKTVRAIRDRLVESARFGHNGPLDDSCLLLNFDTFEYDLRPSLRTQLN